MEGPFWIDSHTPVHRFPDVAMAMEEPDGLLAVGGDLSSARLLAAYSQGIFPWYSAGQPILWWSPNPRAVLYPSKLRVSRSLRKRLRKREYRVSLDEDFTGVIQGCSEPRSGQDGTWITAEMKLAYQQLHEEGYAHSVEAWYGSELVGGLYGVALGKAFFGESMFSRRTDASKVAFVHLTRQLMRWGYHMIDCQVSSEHLASLGAEEIAREEFIQQLQTLVYQTAHPMPWRMEASDSLLADIMNP
ncbi:MAG: leucyl/phenylalanyl-tRNA--protein transferase [Gammaproteobacteria bacterium]|nr:leucyl/phenylalanyl-tRNA--protein transferase [Gammaproteobacteria bacterium]